MPECDANSLNASAVTAGFHKLQPQDKQAIMLYLLRSIAGLSAQSPDDLAESAKCFCFSDPRQANAVRDWLLCQIANGGTPGECENLEGAASPDGSVTPDFIGQYYEDTVAGVFYRSTGLTSADWVVVAGGESVWLSDTIAYIYLEKDTYSGPMVFPNLTAMENGFDIYTTGWSSLSAPLLATLGNYLTFDGTTYTPFANLGSVLLPSLAQISGSITFLGCPVLSTIQFSNALVSNAGAGAVTFNFSGCALTQTSVDHILAAFDAGQVGAAAGGRTLNLSGGTNAAPSAAGLASKTSLEGKGWTVTVNP